jgi:hypothetical protein
MRNQQGKENLSSIDSLLITTAANLTREMNSSCEYQQQLLGDQTSLEYILSCSNRSNNKNEDIQSILTRTARIAKVTNKLLLNKSNNNYSIFFLKDLFAIV